MGECWIINLVCALSRFLAQGDSSKGLLSFTSCVVWLCYNRSLFVIFTEGKLFIAQRSRSKNTPAFPGCIETRSLMKTIKSINRWIRYLKRQWWLWVSISIDWSVTSITFKFKLSIVIDLSNGFPISVFIDWTRRDTFIRDTEIIWDSKNWPLNGGWPLKRWPLNRGSPVLH